jgi:hypothetical protein
MITNELDCVSAGLHKLVRHCTSILIDVLITNGPYGRVSREDGLVIVVETPIAG